MSASTTPTGRVAVENELLAQLGLPPSATPEDVDQLHLAVSQFLAAAPNGIKGWARAQASVLDEAYLKLTDPVGLEGSALRSPTRPPTVVPGGPATPPARRGPVPAAPADELLDDDVEEPEAPALDALASAADEPAAEDAEPEALDDTDTDDMDALYASVTPGAHRDMVSGGKAPKAAAAVAAPPDRPKAPAKAAPRGATGRQAVPAAAVTPPAGDGPWKFVAVGATVLLGLVVLFAFVVPFVFNLGTGAPAADSSVAPSASGPTVDMNQITTLMTQLQAKPNDIATMQAIGDTYFNGADYNDASTFYNNILAIDPNNIKALIASGATSYNLSDTATAEKIWKQVVALNPSDKGLAQEVHYDLGLLYMHQTTPDWANVIYEWKQVIAIDPTSTNATTVAGYITEIAQASMLPASLLPDLSAPPVLASAPAPSGSATPSAAAASSSPAPSGAAAPSGSAAPAAGPVVNEGAKGMAFTSGTLNAPANTPFTIHFDNQDSGVPHDMLIKDSAGTTVFSGDMVTGPAAVDYRVPALPAGTYTFTCTVHPTAMNGTLVVGG